MTPAQKAELARKRTVARMSDTMSVQQIAEATGYDEDEVIAILALFGRSQPRIAARCFRTGATVTGFTPRGLYRKAQLLGWGALGADWDFCGVAA